MEIVHTAFCSRVAEPMALVIAEPTPLLAKHLVLEMAQALLDHSR
jgi:hypothetical protein